LRTNPDKGGMLPIDACIIPHKPNTPFQLPDMAQTTVFPVCRRLKEALSLFFLFNGFIHRCSGFGPCTEPVKPFLVEYTANAQQCFENSASGMRANPFEDQGKLFGPS
jgi:hypothetical protein